MGKTKESRKEFDPDDFTTNEDDNGKLHFLDKDCNPLIRESDDPNVVIFGSGLRVPKEAFIQYAKTVMEEK
jgi:hypothetical protein